MGGGLFTGDSLGGEGEGSGGRVDLDLAGGHAGCAVVVGAPGVVEGPVGCEEGLGGEGGGGDYGDFG